GEGPSFMRPRQTSDHPSDPVYRAAFELESLGAVDVSALESILARLPWLEWSPLEMIGIGGAVYVGHRGVARRCVGPSVEPGSSWRVYRPSLVSGQVGWHANELLPHDAPPE